MSDSPNGGESICPLWSEYGSLDLIPDLIPGLDSELDSADSHAIEEPMSEAQQAAHREFMDANR